MRFLTALPEAYDETPGERFSLQYDIGRRQQRQRLQQTNLQQYNGVKYALDTSNAHLKKKQRLHVLVCMFS